MYHGFTLPDNLHDCVQLELSLSEEESSRLDRQRAQFVLQVGCCLLCASSLLLMFLLCTVQALNLHSASKRLSKEFCVAKKDGISKEVWMFISLQVCGDFLSHYQFI